MRKEDDDNQTGYLEDQYPSTKTVHYGGGFGGLVLQHTMNRMGSMFGYRLPASMALPALLPGQLNIHGIDGEETNHSFTPSEEFFPALRVTSGGREALWVCDWKLKPGSIAKNLYNKDYGTSKYSIRTVNEKEQVIITRLPPIKELQSSNDDSGEATTSAPGLERCYYWPFVDSTSGTRKIRTILTHTDVEGFATATLTDSRDKVTKTAMAQNPEGGTWGYAPYEDVGTTKEINSITGNELAGFAYFPKGDPDNPKAGEVWLPAYSRSTRGDDFDLFTAESSLSFALSDYSAFFTGAGFPPWNATDHRSTYNATYAYRVASTEDSAFQPYFREWVISSKSDYNHSGSTWNDNWYRETRVMSGDTVSIGFFPHKHVKADDSDKRLFSAQTTIFGMITTTSYSQSDSATEPYILTWADPTKSSLEVIIFNTRTGEKKASLVIPGNASLKYVYQGYEVVGVCLVYKEPTG